jgi:hypothetical protein
MRRVIVIAALAGFGLLACAQPAPDGNDVTTQPGTGSSTGDQQQDWAAIEALEDEARDLARATGCPSADQCRAAPVGNRACGGPRYYFVYCATTTDSSALYARLDEIVRAEDEYNRRYEMVSTCEFRMPPDIAFSGGECRPTSEVAGTVNH